VDIIFPRGISKAGSLLDLAVVHNVVTRTGTWFAYKDMRLGQGRDNAREFLENNPELAAEIETRTREILGIPRPAPSAESSAPSARSIPVAGPDGKPARPAGDSPARPAGDSPARPAGDSLAPREASSPLAGRSPLAGTSGAPGAKVVPVRAPR